MVTKHDIYTHIQAAFSDVDSKRMQELVANYIRLVYKKFKSNESYTWTDPVTLRWIPLRARCGVFISGGQVHNVLDSFHQVFPLMAIVRQNSNFGNYSVNAIMYYPHIAQKCFNKCCLLGMDDARCYLMRDRLMQLYDSRHLPEPAIRIGPQQLRKLVNACAD